MDSSVWLYAFAVVVIGAVVLTRLLKSPQKTEAPATAQYSYTRRDYIMTRAEAAMFRRLENIAGDRYYIFPQVHLSSLLKHDVKGQNWKAALSKIQRKSVDFVLVDRRTLVTAYAVELDDASHDLPDRQTRDEVVAGLLSAANVPLVRLRHAATLSDEALEAMFEQVASASKQ